TRKMVLDKKQIQAIFLLEFRMSHKAVETTHNINNTSGPGTDNECTVQWWFKKFCKRDESLEDEEHFAKELTVDHSMVIQHLKQIGKVKKLNKWVPHELTESQKNHFEVSSSLILCNDNEPLIKQIVTSQQLDQEIAPKNFPKSNLHQKKVVITDWQSTAHLIHYSFLIPKKPFTPVKYAQQIYHMHRKLQCLQVALINRNDPILLHDNAQPHITQPMFLPHPPHSPDLLPTDYHFFKHLNNFFLGKCFQNHEEAENAFQEIFES
ncbi:hypothetical protein FD754_020388, partial [Muntiacus muntjak]